MLEIKNVCKTYRTGALVQKALDNVTLNLRDNEFVAVLGPSGSGKTTLLNIIGGLDRYDDGELVINGVSTKKYRDRDWDAYRNHSIGFVFQSYNLIPHQSILSNVELALTISGIGRAERRRRAKQALEQVGLGDQLHKHPNQLSGGQMQRVAIARALVNDPDILLADEPTGALDTETSLQVMDLLRGVAKDRLVIMVTHNPELAEQYATRIVRLRDGRITSDSDPFHKEAETAQPAVHKRMGKASMSFGTAIALSFNNLRTKLGRTLLTAFAGSIGIIGIALILSMSNGVDHYIQTVEEDTLKSYPLEITDASLSLTSLYSFSDTTQTAPDTEVLEWHAVTDILSGVNANDLASLKNYLENEGSEIFNYVQAIEYDYNLSPQIYLESNGTFRQVNPDRSFAALGFSSPENVSGMFSAFSNTDTFRPMPKDASLYTEQYELKAGHWPENSNECIVVLTAQGRIADLTLYVLGMKNPEELDEMLQAFTAGESYEADTSVHSYRYDDFLGIEFRLLNSADYYAYDETYHVWADRSDDEKYMQPLLEAAEKLTVVGVVQPKGDNRSGSLRTGICYPASLTEKIINYAASSRIVQMQRREPKVNVFTGQDFGEKANADALSMDSLFHVDEDAVRDLFAFDPSDLSFDPSAFDLSSVDLSQISLDPNAFSVTMPTLSEQDLSKLLDGVEITLSGEQAASLLGELLTNYLAFAEKNPSTDYAKLPEAFQAFLKSESAAAVMNEALTELLAQAGANTITPEQLLDVVQSVMDGYPAFLEANGLQEEDASLAYLSLYLQSDIAQAILNQNVAALRAQLNAMLPSDMQLSALAERLYTAYQTYAAQNALPQPEQLQSSFEEYLGTPEAKELLMRAANEAVDLDRLKSNAASVFDAYASSAGAQISSAMSGVFTSVSNQLTEAITNNMSRMAEQLSGNLRSALEIDPEAFAEAISMQMDMSQLRDLISALLSGEKSSYAGNLKKLGFANEAEPAEITIYPKDFQGKQKCKQILEAYNDMQLANGRKDKVIVYTDMVDTLMRSVTDIVNAISIVLIAFVAVSLVVSSIMIGIITYISVLERTKEIGILRAIGASKRNISNVFNAETFLVGLFAGAMGVGITLLLLLPINMILHRLTGINEVKAILPVGGAVILVLLSMFLTIVAGLIPSRKAAKKDPVTALRTE